MNNLYNFQEYKIVENTRRTSIFIKTITVLIFIVILIIICKFNYKVYVKLPILKEEDKYILSIPAEEIDLLDNNKILIDKKEYNFTIYKTELNNINNIIIETIYLDINMYNSELKYNNCLLLKSNETLLKTIIKFIKGGI